MTAEWWGPTQEDAPGAPLHRMLDVSEDVFRRAACSGRKGTGHVKGASEWKPGERCVDCLSGVTSPL